MAYDATGVAIGLISSLDDKGFKDAQEEAKKLGIEITRAGNDGNNGFKKIEKGAKTTANSFLEVAAKAAMAWESIRKFVNASLDQARADASLNQAIKNNTDERSREGKSVSALTKEYKSFATTQQEATGIQEEVTQNLQSVLLSFGVMPSMVNRVTTAIQDMSAVTDVDSLMMAKAWARLQEAPDEALSALGRAGVRIRKEQLEGMTLDQQRIYVLELLEQKFKGQAKVVADATGGVAQANVAFGEFAETVGNVVIKGLRPFIDIFSKILNWFSELPGLVSGGIIAIGGISAAFFALNGVINMTPVGWILSIGAAIAGIAEATGLFGDSVKSMQEHMATLVKKSDELYKADQHLDNLRESIGNLAYGTDAYKNAVEEILAQNPKIRGYGVNASSTFDTISNAIFRARQENVSLRNEIQKTAADTFNTATRMARSQLHFYGAFMSSAEKQRIREGMVEASAMYLYVTQSRDAISSMIAENNFGDQARLVLKDRMAKLAQDLGMDPDDLVSIMTGRWRQERKSEEASPTSKQGVNKIVSDGSGDKAQKTEVDLDALRSRLAFGYYEKRKAMERDYENSVNEINSAVNLTETERAEALDLLKRDKIIKQGELAAQTIAEGMDIGTQVIKGDWKGAISSTLGTISPTLSTVFSSAVSFFGSLFGSTSKSEAEKLGEWLTKAVKKFDASFKESEFYAKLYGDSSELALDSSISTLTDAVQENLKKLGLSANMTRDQFQDFFDTINKADYRKINWDDYTAKSTNTYSGYGGTRTSTQYNNIFRTGSIDFRSLTKNDIAALAGQIRHLFNDMYGEYADEMMQVYGLTGSDENIWHKWASGVKDDLSGVNDRILEITQQTADWIAQLDDAELKKALDPLNEGLDRLTDKLDAGDITDDEWLEQSKALYENSIAYLKTLDQTQEVIDAIVELRAKENKLAKENNAEAEKAIVLAQKVNKTYAETVLDNMAEMYKTTRLTAGITTIPTNSFIPQLPAGIGTPVVNRSSTVSNNNSSSNSNNTVTNVNANISLTPNLVQELARQILAQSGRSLLK